MHTDLGQSSCTSFHTAPRATAMCLDDIQCRRMGHLLWYPGRRRIHGAGNDTELIVSQVPRVAHRFLVVLERVARTGSTWTYSRAWHPWGGRGTPWYPSGVILPEGRPGIAVTATHPLPGNLSFRKMCLFLVANSVPPGWGQNTNEDDLQFNFPQRTLISWWSDGLSSYCCCQSSFGDSSDGISAGSPSKWGIGRRWDTNYLLFSGAR